MENETNNLSKQWFEFAKMDFETAKHLNATMHPKPLEIICYHCQQAAEKLLKGLLISKGEEIQKTHDLGLLADQLSKHINIEEKYFDVCDNLTPFGVRVRYPQETSIEEAHVAKALKETQELFDFFKI